MTWAVKSRYGYEAVEIVKETAKTATYIDRRWGNTQTRVDLSNLLDWRGDEETAQRLVAQLTSARAERERRQNAATAWFNKRRDEILAASGMEAGTVETEGLDPKDDSPVGSEASETPNPLSSTNPNTERQSL